MVLEVSTGEEQVSLEPWKAVLTTAELQQEWDPAVEDAHLVEMFDQNTRISKTNYSLGWPAKYVSMSFLNVFTHNFPQPTGFCYYFTGIL